MRCGRYLHLLIIVAASACSDEPTSPGVPRVIAPECAQPAPLLGQFNPAAPLLLVIFRDKATVDADITRLANKYAFTPSSRWSFGFAAMLTPAALAGVRCEPSVELVEYDGIVTIAGR